MPRKPPATVSTIAGYVDWVEQVGQYFTTPGGYEAPWFRGAANGDHPLVPGLYRSKYGRRRAADDELRFEFARKALPMVADRAPRNWWEWYFLMQHYRAPTRLLDWTDSAMVALHFALTSWDGTPYMKKDPLPAVWALNPFALNRRSGHEWGPFSSDWRKVQPYLPEPYMGGRIPLVPIALDPEYIAQRMLVQHSHFTLHGRDKRGLDEMRKDLRLENGLFRVTLNFSVGDIDYHRWHMTLLGITSTSAFPDLEGLARELRMEYGL